MIDRDFEDILKKLLAGSEEAQKFMAALDKKIDLHIQKAELKLEQIESINTQQNIVLEKINNKNEESAKNEQAREQEIKDSIKLVEDRIEQLEEPKKWLSTAFKILIALGAIAGAIYAILRLIKG